MALLTTISIMISVISVLTSSLIIGRVKKQISAMADLLADVKNGNGNRRILSAESELTAPLAYEINDIIVFYENRLSAFRQAEGANKQLMTSLSHDVRTHLTTLIGYLDKNERIYRTADCHRCHSLNQCCFIKFPNRRILSVVIFLSARNGAFIQAGLSLGNFSIHYSDDEFIRDCRKSV